MDAVKLQQFFLEQKQPSFRLKQALEAVFKHNCFSYEAMTTLPKALISELNQNLPFFSFAQSQVLISHDKRAHKALLKLRDGNSIETVLLEPKPGQLSVCLSAQVGCVYHCAFCATGALGFKRNLTAEEITDQVLFWQKYLAENKLSAKTLHSLIFMGMGEPLANLENLTKSIEILTDPDQFAFSQRKIAVSTSTTLPTILTLTAKFPQISLAISLHSANQNIRQKLMPQTKAFSLNKTEHLLKQYFAKHRRKVFLEYLLIKDLTDTKEQIQELADFIEKINEPALLHVNLIPYNKTSAAGLEPSHREKIIQIKNQLARHHIPTTVRKSLGDDIAGACGQLANLAKK